MNSYAKLKQKVSDCEEEIAQMRSDIFMLLYGMDEDIEMIVSKWNNTFHKESNAIMPKDVMFIQPLERE